MDATSQKFLENFGDAVRAARNSHGWSQEDLAGQTGLDRTYVSGIERGRRNPTLTTLFKISSALGLRIDELLAMPQIHYPNPMFE